MFGSRYIYCESIRYRAGVSDNEIPVSKASSFFDRFFRVARFMVHRFIKMVFYCAGFVCVSLFLSNVLLFLIFCLFKNWDNLQQILTKVG